MVRLLPNTWTTIACSLSIVDCQQAGTPEGARQTELPVGTMWESQGVAVAKVVAKGAAVVVMSWGARVGAERAGLRPTPPPRRVRRILLKLRPSTSGEYQDPTHACRARIRAQPVFPSGLPTQSSRVVASWHRRRDMSITAPPQTHILPLRINANRSFQVSPS